MGTVPESEVRLAGRLLGDLLTKKGEIKFSEEFFNKGPTRQVEMFFHEVSDGLLEIVAAAMQLKDAGLIEIVNLGIPEGNPLNDGEDFLYRATDRGKVDGFDIDFTAQSF